MALKALSRDDKVRPQDSTDLMHLMNNANSDDLELACQAAKQIELRGFNRDRDLVTALKTAWNQYHS